MDIAATIFTTHAKSTESLMREPNTGFYLPPYQRNYQWEMKDHVNLTCQNSVRLPFPTCKYLIQLSTDIINVAAVPLQHI